MVWHIKIKKRVEGKRESLRSKSKFSCTHSKIVRERTLFISIITTQSFQKAKKAIDVDTPSNDQRGTCHSNITTTQPSFLFFFFLFFSSLSWSTLPLSYHLQPPINSQTWSHQPLISLGFSLTQASLK